MPIYELPFEIESTLSGSERYSKKTFLCEEIDKQALLLVFLPFMLKVIQF